jgi:hypothetical protein
MRGLQDAGAARGVRRQGNVGLQGPDKPIGIASRKRNTEIAGKASISIAIHAAIGTARKNDIEEEFAERGGGFRILFEFVARNFTSRAERHA